jgi:hypothetical protein
MRPLKGNLNFFGLPRLGGSSAPERQRRAFKAGSEEWLKMERPGSLVRVLGFIFPPSKRS